MEFYRQILGVRCFHDVDGVLDEMRSVVIRTRLWVFQREQERETNQEVAS